MAEPDTGAKHSRQGTQYPPTTNTSTENDGDDDVLKRRVANDYTTYKPLPSQQSIRLLRILTVQETGNDGLTCVLYDCPGWRNITFIALSYTWGDISKQREIALIHLDTSQDVKPPSAEGGRPRMQIYLDQAIRFNITENLYEALLSLRDSAARKPQLRRWFSLGVPFWIDAVCINQGDFDERSSQVSMMGDIFSQASLVMAFLGESEDVGRGLYLVRDIFQNAIARYGWDFDVVKAGADHFHELMRYNFVIDGIPRETEESIRVLERLFAHSYFRRVWILQEVTVQPEKTIFHHEKTFDMPVRLIWIIFAFRFRIRWRAEFPRFDGFTMPHIWAGLVQPRMSFANTVPLRRVWPAERSTIPEISTSLYWLFLDTSLDFDATDIRDKLFALLDLCHETKGDKKHHAGLLPDYSKAAEQIFADFGRWLILHGPPKHELSILNYLGGSRTKRVTHDSDFVKFQQDALPRDLTDEVDCVPSWAPWPVKDNRRPQTCLLETEPRRGGDLFSLATAHPARVVSVKDSIPQQVPQHVADRLLGLKGKRIGIVRHVMPSPIRCFAPPNPADPKGHHTLALVHPYQDPPLRYSGGIVLVWQLMKQLMTGATVTMLEKQMAFVNIGDSARAIFEDLTGSPYRGKEDSMLLHLLETLLLSPVCNISHDIPDVNLSEAFPSFSTLDKRILAVAFAQCWALNDPEFASMPQNMRHLLSKYWNEPLDTDQQFPCFFHAHGKCLFVTENHRMGLCPGDTHQGDIVVGLHGGRTPFVLRPLQDLPDLNEEPLSFDGEGDSRPQFFRFIGECYLHGCMTSGFFDNADLGEVEVFQMC